MKRRNDNIWEILLVEDNPADVFLAQEALKDAGIPHNLQVAEDGAVALEYLQGQTGDDSAARPDIILLDLNMPRMSGFELLARVKTNEDLKSIPMIILTSSVAAEDISRAYALNANSYTRKPSEIDGFIDVIKGIVDFWFKISVLPRGPVNNQS